MTYQSAQRFGIRPLERRYNRVQVLGPLSDQLLRVAAQLGKVLRGRVVEVVARPRQLDLQAPVALRAQHVAQLVVDGVGDPVEDHVEDWAGPFDEAPVVDVREAAAAGALPGSEREQHHLGARVEAQNLGEGAHRRVDGEHAAVDQRALAHGERLEVGRRGRRRPRDHGWREVLGPPLARVAGLEEEGARLGHVVGGHDQLGDAVRQPLVPEEALQGAVERAGVVLLVEQALGAPDALPDGAVEDRRPLLLVDRRHLLGREGIRGTQGAGQDSACRGARDQVEQLEHAASGAALELGQDQGGNEAAYPATIYCKHPHGATVSLQMGAVRAALLTLIFLACLTAGAIAVAQEPPPGEPPDRRQMEDNPCLTERAKRLLCPDLVMRRPYGLYTERLTKPGNTVLRAGNVIDSVGKGPAELHGVRIGPRFMKGRQRIYKRSGGKIGVTTGARLQFKFAHQQLYWWKFYDAARFELWRLDEEGRRTRLVRPAGHAGHVGRLGRHLPARLPRAVDRRDGAERLLRVRPHRRSRERDLRVERGQQRGAGDRAAAVRAGAGAPRLQGQGPRAAVRARRPILSRLG